jgi:hypothetical protein
MSKLTCCRPNGNATWAGTGRGLAGLSGVEPPWVLSLERSDWRPAVPGVALSWMNFLVLGIVRDGGWIFGCASACPRS